MAATLRDLLATRALELRPIRGDAGADDAIQWVSSTDLTDPTPFLSDAQVVLTTGRQFAGWVSGEDYDAYVGRLKGRGVVALGFGTEVLRSGTPAELESACAVHSLPLFEVPYHVPFIAVIRWVADELARQARSRDDWALHAQRAVSLAALGEGGLADAVAEASRRLERRIVIFDADGTLDHADSGAAARGYSAQVAAAVTELLHRGRRASRSIGESSDHVVLQTLGKNGRLRGVLAVSGGAGLDKAERSVITTLVALAEVSLENSQSLRESIRSLLEQLFMLLLSGQVDAVRRALGPLSIALPKGEFRVVAAFRSDVSAELRNTLERWAMTPTNELYVADHATELVVLAPSSAIDRVVRAFAAAECPIGISEQVEFARLDAGTTQAARALENARNRRLAAVGFADMVHSSVLGLLSSSAVAEVASVRLSALIGEPEGLHLLECASVWLEHNCRWDSAAKQLGIHRHSLHARMRKLETALDISLDRFADRAQLWALLTAADLSGHG